MTDRALRLVVVVCDGEPSGLGVSFAVGAGVVAARFADLCARGHADLAFDLACEALGRRKADAYEASLRARGIAAVTSAGRP